MKKYGRKFIIAALLLLSPSSYTTSTSPSFMTVQAQEDENGNYVPPYSEDDTNDDDEYDHDDSNNDKYKPRYCNILALSDAQHIGPYQAGVIKELVNSLRNGDQEYEVVSGISVGAINAHIMSQYPIGQEKDASNKLIDFWFEIAEKNSDLVKSWSWGMIYGFFYENSIYDASDLYEFIETFFKASKVQRHVNLGIANVLTGRYHSFGMHHSDEELIKVLQASISFPGVFKTVQFQDSLWFTGSAIYEIDVLGPINHCRELGYKDKYINVDAIVSGDPKLNSVYANIFNAFGIIERTTEVMDYYEMIFGVVKAQMGHPKVNFRHIIGPPRKMPNRIIPLQFTTDEVDNQIKLGLKDTKQYLKDYNEQQRKNKAQNKPIVMSDSTEEAVEEEGAPYHCLVNKRYHNEERQKRYEAECGRFKKSEL